MAAGESAMNAMRPHNGASNPESEREPREPWGPTVITLIPDAFPTGLKVQKNSRKLTSYEKEDFRMFCCSLRLDETGPC